MIGDDADDGPWTLEQHLAAGLAAVARIVGDPDAGMRQPVCHHFAEIVPVDPEQVSVDRRYASLAPIFAMLGLDFAADRLEAWERALPTIDWMTARIPMLVEAASAGGLRYEGWSWEPQRQQPICATTFQIIGNRTD